MGFGHYRIAMAGASAAHAMGFTPLWLDLLGIPGVTSGRNQLVEHQLQQVLPDLAAHQAVQQICVGVGDLR